jgi:dienelactone hydrolase
LTDKALDRSALHEKLSCFFDQVYSSPVPVFSRSEFRRGIQMSGEVRNEDIMSSQASRTRRCQLHDNLRGLNVLPELPASVRSRTRRPRKRTVCRLLSSLIAGAVRLSIVLFVCGVLAQAVLAQDWSEEAEPARKNQVALPDQISVETPDSEVDSAAALFAGAWAGDGWNGVIPAALVVEKINHDGSANAIFAWGDISPTRRRGWVRVVARIDGKSLTLSIPDYGTAEFSMTPDGRLFGRYRYLSGRRDYTILSRLTVPDRPSIIAASQSMLSGEDIAIPLVVGSDSSQSVQLHGILYRSKLPGPQPLAIFSGDTVASESARLRPNRAPIRSRQMLGLGYSMLVLQRKGMGGSDGKFMEPRNASIPQATQLQSALEDLDAAVTYMKRQEYVDPSRIVVMGINRGGLLSVAYAGLHDGSVAGVVNNFGHWAVHRSWWQKLTSFGDFTATELANAGKRTKVPMLWIYGGTDPAAMEYARENFRAFTFQGGRGTFVDVLTDAKAGTPSEVLIERQEKAIVDYIKSLR